MLCQRVRLSEARAGLGLEKYYLDDTPHVRRHSLDWGIKGMHWPSHVCLDSPFLGWSLSGFGKCEKKKLFCSLFLSLYLFLLLLLDITLFGWFCCYIESWLGPVLFKLRLKVKIISICTCILRFYCLFWSLFYVFGRPPILVSNVVGLLLTS